MDSAFNPVGNTICLKATVSNAKAVKNTALDANQFRVYNTGLYPVFFAFGETKDLAESAMVIPTASITSRCFPIAAGSVEIFSGPIGGWVCAMTADDPCDVFVTPGRGM